MVRANARARGVIDLRLGDAFEGLAALEPGSVDVTITDPPFDQRTHRAALEVGDWRAGGRRLGAALPFSPLDSPALAKMAKLLARVTRRWIIVFAAERQLEPWAVGLETGGARFIRLGYALRKNPRPQMSGDRPAPAADPIVIAHAGSADMRWNGGGAPARWETPGARYDHGGQVHPCQKPLPLIRSLVEAFSDPGELVIDPFAGVGTTAVACKEAGRRFLGWEIGPAYHAAALRRLDDTREQLGLGLAG